MKHFIRKHIISLSILGVSCILGSSYVFADPNALWKIVNEQCVPNQLAGQVPSPCAEVNLSQGQDKGYALLKDRVGPLQYLLIPTARVTGIESPVLLQPASTNYWSKAWNARHYMIEKYGKPIPRQYISLAINSSYGRSQNQLHIHISCINPTVYQQLDDLKDSISSKWQTLPVELVGHNYLAYRLDSLPDDKIEVDPFKLLAEQLPEAKEDMGRYTIAMAANQFADGKDGFILLVDKANLSTLDRGSAEELQDHDCSILKLKQ